MKNSLPQAESIKGQTPNPPNREKEEWSYSNLDFVADCGGLLGLFIGFNFVMIWDLFVIIYQRMKGKVFDF